MPPVPTAPAIRSPTLVLPAHRLTYCEATEQGHLRLALAGADGASVKGIAFRAADGPLGAFLQQRRGANIHAAGTLRINRWGSSVSAQLQLRDAADTTAA